MTAEEDVEQRRGDLAKGYEIGACDLPEGRSWEVFAPEGLPTGDGAFVGSEAFGQFTDPPPVRPLPHRADQDDNGAQVELSAQEAHRGRCRSLSAIFAITAEAQSEALELG